MGYQNSAVLHAAQAIVRNQAWICKCSSCKRMRREGIAPQITERIELKALMVELGEQILSSASGEVNKINDDEVKDLLQKKRARMQLQNEFERIAAEKRAKEAAEKNIAVPYPTKGQGAGGGKRIIRSGKEMS